MSDISVDWAAAPVDRDYTAAALEGAQAGQAQRAIGALRGINLDDPASLNTGIANLVRAGAADQASALMGLQLKRSAIQMTPQIMQALSGGGQQQPQGPDPAAAGQLHAQVAQDARAFSQTPPDQQPAAAAALKAKYLKLGVPEGAIDSALAHAATPGGADDLAGVHDNHATMLNGGQVSPDANMAHGGSYNWAQSLLGNPGLQTGIDFIKQYGGPDFTGRINTAREIMAPEIAAEANVRNARAQAAESGAGAATADLATVTLPNGSTMQVPKSMALQLGAGGALHGLTPGEQAQQTAAGSAAGSSPANVQTIKLPGGREQQVTFAPGPNGTYVATPIPVADGSGTHRAAPTSSPGEVEANTKSNAQYQADRELVAGSNNRLTVLKTVEHLLESPEGKTGPGTQAVNGMKSFLLAQAPSVLAQIDGGLDKAKLAIATQDKLHKYMVQAAGLSAAQYGQGTNEKLAFAASGNANNDISTLANKDVTRVNIALERANQAKLDAFQKTGQSGDHYSDFSANWGSTIDPRAFMLDMMSKSERLKLQDTIKTGPEQQAYARGVRAAIAAKIYSRADIK